MELQPALLRSFAIVVMALVMAAGWSVLKNGADQPLRPGLRTPGN